MGAIALLGGLLGVSVLSVQATAVLLLIAGLLAIGAEVKVGAHGLVGFGGVVAIAMASGRFSYPSSRSSRPGSWSWREH